jgi:hypothetical protein
MTTYHLSGVTLFKVNTQFPNPKTEFYKNGKWSRGQYSRTQLSYPEVGSEQNGIRLLNERLLERKMRKHLT